MLIIKDKDKLEYYMDKYNIQDIFSTDMKEHMELILFNKNEHICRAGEKIHYLYFLVDGKTKAYTLLKNGKSLLLQFCTPLEMFGDVEFMDISRAISNIEAMGNTLCIGISMDNLRKYALNDIKFLRYACKILSRKLDKSSRDSSINLLYPLENRLASYILAITPNNYNLSAVDEMTTHNLSEMADLLGTSYRHLIRTINKLSEQRIIKKEKSTLIVLNRKLLEQLAGDLYY